MKKIFCFLQLLFLILFCAQIFAAVSIQDDAGRTIVLKHFAKRIVTLAPNETEILFAIGAGKYIVGAENHSDYPKLALSIPRIGRYPDFDIERILNLSPDLIVMPKMAISLSLIKTFSQYKIPVYVMNIQHIKDIYVNMQKLGVITKNKLQAKRAAQDFKHQWLKLKKQHAFKKKVAVFLQLWDEPLITINGNNPIDSVIEVCGGKNIFAQLHEPYPTISLANVLIANPQIIIAGNANQLKIWQKWKTVLAVKNNNLYAIPANLIQRYSPRILQGAKMLCSFVDKARLN